ncbi:hypothetical protein KTD31_17390 [Burkholderia multivorans]|uniref:hypothetical protein n=1 Tax=Burkholderia multivorans TaxID=87883 RepID=UPI001C23D5E5|nr:hypothetical protein [Burkholderia multivorans]MBU9203133.1 hypothetical protein [Burkholderia multivorans]
MKGGALLGAGAFGLKMFDGAIKSADQYYHQLALLKNIGMSQVEVAESVKKAWDTTHEVMSTKAADNIKTLLELRSAFGEGKYHEALAILPTVQRLGAVLQSITGAPQDHVGFDMIKAIEIGTKGALSEEGVKKQAEMMSKAIIAMNGTVTVADFHQALKYSRAAAPYMSDEFKYQYLPTLIQEFKTGHGGASGAGNTIASLFGVIVGKMIPKDLIQNWVDSGLVNPRMVVHDKHNRTTSKILPGGIVGSDEFAQNPEAYAQKYIKPAIQRLMAQKHISEIDAFYALTKNRIAAFGLQTLVNKGLQFQRDKGLINLAPDSSTAYNNLAKTDPELARAQMAAQWENLKVRLAYDVMPKLIQAFNWLTPKLSDLVGFMEKHQTAVTAFVGAFLGLSALSAVAGSIMLVSGAAKALSLALSLTGVGGLGGAIGALATPVGIAVLALGTLAAAIYAFRPMSQSEIDSYKTDGGVKLSAGAKARIDAGALNTVSPLAKHQGTVQTSIHLDGRKIADAMTPYVSSAMSKSSNTSNLDYALSLPMPGMN